MTLLNYWHYITLGIISLFFVAGVVASLKQKGRSLQLGMLFSVTLVSLFLAILSVVLVDKYTKKVALYKLKNRRYLATEEILYRGIVKNRGNFDIGKVTFEIKIVNKGHAIGHLKGGDFYKSSGFFDFFKDGLNIRSKPQSITKDFVVARDLKAGEARAFVVRFKYPPYFRNTSQYPKVWGH